MAERPCWNCTAKHFNADDCRGDFGGNATCPHIPTETEMLRQELTTAQTELEQAREELTDIGQTLSHYGAPTTFNGKPLSHGQALVELLDRFQQQRDEAARWRNEAQRYNELGHKTHDKMLTAQVERDEAREQRDDAIRERDEALTHLDDARRACYEHGFEDDNKTVEELVEWMNFATNAATELASEWSKSDRDALAAQVGEMRNLLDEGHLTLLGACEDCEGDRFEAKGCDERDGCSIWQTIQKLDKALSIPPTHAEQVYVAAVEVCEAAKAACRYDYTPDCDQECIDDMERLKQALAHYASLQARP
jgi:hypothetical protein